MTRPNVFLFDIDGTLIRTGGAGRRAMVRAFAEVLDAPEALEGIRLGGMTDRLILRAAFKNIGRAFSESLEASVVQRYLAHLDAELLDAPNYRVMPGVYETLDACEGHGALGLGTGNVEAGARRKLEPADLNRRFPFGGFGERAEVRAQLVEDGARRGAEHLGMARAEVRVVVIGDTPKDIEAAHASGAECVAVATGSFGVDELSAADHAFESLEATGAVEAILGPS
ncbi:MAG: HAD family hydrolase [Myxococcota bacterium]